MKPSPFFECNVTLGHRVILSKNAAQPFYEKNHKRIKVIATYHKESITIYTALYFREDLYFISFGKRYQKMLGLPYGENFKLQIHEDDTKYGAAMPEELQAVLDSDWEALEKFETLTDG